MNLEELKSKRWRLKLVDTEVFVIDYFKGQKRPILIKYRLHKKWDVAKCDFEMIEEISPYDGFQTDDKVLVWDEGVHEDDKEKRHFSHIDEEGKPCVFVNGRTSFTSNGYTAAFDHCEKWKGE